MAQLTGPLKKNTTYACPVPAGRYAYIHFGIETPQVPPMSEVDLEDMTSFILTLDGKEFKINASDILEFADLSVTSLTITPQQDVDRYTIIQVAYAAIKDREV